MNPKTWPTRCPRCDAEIPRMTGDPQLDVLLHLQECGALDVPVGATGAT